MTAFLRQSALNAAKFRVGAQKITAAYNKAGDDDVPYADGEVSNIFAFDGQYAYGNHRTWLAIEKTMQTLRERNGHGFVASLREPLSQGVLGNRRPNKNSM